MWIKQSFWRLNCCPRFDSHCLLCVFSFCACIRAQVAGDIERLSQEQEELSKMLASLQDRYADIEQQILFQRRKSIEEIVSALSCSFHSLDAIQLLRSESEIQGRDAQAYENTNSIWGSSSDETGLDVYCLERR